MEFDTRNPLARLAATLPGRVMTAILVVGTCVAVGAALFYAYDQDVLFPERHFPRTWVLAGVVAAAGLAVLAPLARMASAYPKAAALVQTLGAGVLVFGAANLANKTPGVIALGAALAVLLAAAASVERTTGAWTYAIAGLAAGAAVTFVTVAVCVVFVSGSA